MLVTDDVVESVLSEDPVRPLRRDLTPVADEGLLRTFHGVQSISQTMFI